MIALFQSIQTLCPVAIVVLLVTGRIHAWMIIALSVVVGITDALSMPSFQSIVPSLVTRKQIGRGLALNSTQFNLSPRPEGHRSRYRFAAARSLLNSAALRRGP